MSESTYDAEKLDQIITYLRNHEKRISWIESHLSFDHDAVEENNFHLALPTNNISEKADTLENQIGQFWFAKTGIVIFAIGIIFLMTFPYKNLPPFVPSLIGYCLCGAIFVLANHWKQSLHFISQYIFGGGLLLLYFSTLRLHYFSPSPVIESDSLILLLLLTDSIGHIIISYLRKSYYLMSSGFILLSVSVLIGNDNWMIFSALVIISAFSVYLKTKLNWDSLNSFSIILVYLVHLIWFLGNPLSGNTLALQNPPLLNIYFLLVYLSIFAAGNISGERGSEESVNTVLNSLINSVFCFLLVMLISLTRFKNATAVTELVCSLVFLTISALYYEKRKSKYSTFFYAIIGYSALTISIVNTFPKPDYFVWLGWQSIIVVATALWFRSKIIIVANFVMYLLIFFSYLVLEDKIGITSLTFGAVALISARILNWQRDRLDLKTDSMRLAYLGSAFFIFPYALYNIVPKDYVALSWTAVAISYYVISVILKNKKYRWLALMTFLLTVFYVLFVGTTNLDPSYRIVSFMFLGIVLLAVSIYYAKKKKGSDLQNN